MASSVTIFFAQNYGGWQQIDSMNEARYSHSSIQLTDGRVLVVGGVGLIDPKSCEIYDPKLNKWNAAPKTNYERGRHKLIMLNSCRVLAVGSPKTKACEIFDPTSNQWIITDSLKVGRVLAQHQVVKLLDDRVLVIGGYTRDFPVTTEDRTLKLCEIFDENVGKWSIADSLKTRRSYHSATLLKDGRVLVVGGTSSVDPLSSCEIYDPAQNKWS
jgi:N-acetylneuraminic acid mutarotase